MTYNIWQKCRNRNKYKLIPTMLTSLTRLFLEKNETAKHFGIIATKLCRYYRFVFNDCDVVSLQRSASEIMQN